MPTRSEQGLTHDSRQSQFTLKELKELLVNRPRIGNDRPRVRQEIIIEAAGSDFEKVVTCLRRYLREFCAADSGPSDADTEHGFAPDDGDMIVSEGTNKIRVTASGIKALKRSGVDLESIAKSTTLSSRS